MGAAMTRFSANRPLTGVTITFIRCLCRVNGVSIVQGVSVRFKSSPDMKGWARQKRLLLAVKPADRLIRKRKVH